MQIESEILTGEADVQDIIEKYQKYVNPLQAALLKMGGFDHIETLASGSVITDESGKEYIDCLGGFGMFSLGHRHPAVIQAVKDQLDKIPLSSKTFLNRPLANLCELLASITPGKLQYSFICNSGTEAVEGAIKIARMSTGRTDIVSTTGSFHGKTMGALSATGRDMYKAPFEPLLPGFRTVAWNEIDAIDANVDDHTAAVIIEPVQGEGGIRLPSSDYLPAIRRICTERGALLIVDEVQTGLGRTGKMFAVDHWNVEPDILTLAKALGGGVLPVGAFISTEDVWGKVFRENPFIHSSTFGGGEAACAAAIAALGIITSQNLAQRSAEYGSYFLEKLKALQQENTDILVEARGLGLMIGVEFADPDIAKLVIGSLANRGVVAAYTLNNANVIRLEPPLIIEKEQLDYVVSAFRSSLADARQLLTLLSD
jgi:putrescine aminotransferase